MSEVQVEEPHAGPMRALAPCAVLALVVLAGPTLAATFLTPGEVTVEVPAGGERDISFTVRNPVNASVAGFARMEGDLAVGATVEPREFRVGSDGSRTIAVTVSAARLERGRYEGVLHIITVEQESGRTEQLRANITALVPTPLLLFGTWSLGLPAPFESRGGYFVMESAVWVAAAYAAMRIVGLLSRRAIRHVPSWVRDSVVSRMTTPVFLLVLALGVKGATRFLPNEGLYAAFRGAVGLAVVVLAAFLVYRVADAVLLYYSKTVAPRTRSTWDDVLIPVLRKVTLALVAAFALIYAMSAVGVDVGFLVAGGIVLGLILSAALGPTLANLFAGLFILMDRPFAEGDDIRLESGETCNVRKIGLRSTRLYYYRNHEIIVVPNSQLESNRVVNLMYPDARYKVHLTVGVAYGSPVDKVTQLLQDVARAHPKVLKEDESQPQVQFDEFGDSALIFRLIVFVPDVRGRYDVASDLRYALDEAFRREGIEVPFPQRTVWLRGDAPSRPPT